MIPSQIKKSPSALHNFIKMRRLALSAEIKTFNLSMAEAIKNPLPQNVANANGKKYQLLLRMAELEEAVLQYKYLQCKYND